MLIKKLINYNKEKPYEKLIFEWSDGIVLKATIDSFFETDNGLEMDDINYKEYYACTIMINEVILVPENCKNSTLYVSTGNILEGKMVEISYQNIPEKIYTQAKDFIWDSSLHSFDL